MNIFLTDDNDIVPVDGNLPLVTGIEELAQLAKQELLSVKGDWFLNLDTGIPLYESIFRRSTSISEVEQVYLDALSRVPGFISIESFDLGGTGEDEIRRVGNITFKAITSDGVLNFNLNGVQ